MEQENKYKGVSREKNNKKPWRARARINGKIYHVGRYLTQEEAAEARDKFINEKNNTQEVEKSLSNPND